MPSLRSSLGSSSNDVQIKVSTTADNQGIDETKKGLKSVGDQADDTGGKFAGMSTAAKVAVAAIGASVIAVGKTFVQSAADLQQTSKSFEVLTGNVEVANALFAQLATYANTTPFEFPDIAKAGQTLLGFGISSNQVYSDIQMLGDIAAATGANFGSLALVFGQVNATGKLMGQDALQLINNQIPIYNILAKKMGIETGKVKQKVEEGAVTIDIFNSAMRDITKEGGFAFKGVDTLAQSFNGRMATLSDSVLDFGRNLIGVKIDPKLGLVIEEGGLFDRLSDLIPEIADSLDSLTPLFAGMVGGLVGVAGSLFELGKTLFEYVSPHLEGLWESIDEHLIPALEYLWKNVLEPLIPIIGITLAGAIIVAVETIKTFIDFFGWIIDEIEAGNPWVIALAAAFGGLAAAMAFQATFNALTAGFTTLRLVTIPSVMTSIGGLRALIMAPMTMGAINVAAALAAIALVIKAVEAAKGAIDAMNNAAKAKSDLAKVNADIRAGADKAYAEGNKAKGDKLMSIANDNSNAPKDPSWFDQFMTGTLGKFSSGGFTGRGARNEVAGTVHRGEYVYAKEDVDQSTGLPKAMGNSTSITIQQMILSTGEAVREFFTIQDNDQQLVAMGLAPRRADG